MSNVSYPSCEVDAYGWILWPVTMPQAWEMLCHWSMQFRPAGVGCRNFPWLSMVWDSDNGYCNLIAII